MKNIIKPIRTQVSAAVIAIMVSQITNAGGFSLYTEGSPAAIGNFAAGIAAEAADASIGWYNPAGLVLIKNQQAVFGGVGVSPNFSLSGVSTYSTTVPGSGGAVSNYSEPFSGLSGAENAVVPSLHYALPLNQNMVFGLSIISPFGLSTDYDINSPVRYSTTRSQLETVNFSPEFGWLLNDHVSVGTGLDLQYARVKFNRVIGTPALLQVDDFDPDTLDSQIVNSGDSFGVGFHAGIMLMFNDRHTRLGLNFQSQMNHSFKGDSQLIGRFADPTLYFFEPLNADPSATFNSKNLYTNAIALPAIVTLSSYQDLNDKWALLGSVVYSNWSSFKSIELNNLAVAVPNLADEGRFILTTANNTTPQNFRNTWRFAAGVNYHIHEQLMLRAGAGYDQTPTVLAYRDVRLPDTDRWALSIGAHYQWRPSVGFDVGYTYLLADENPVINNTSEIRAAINLPASYNNVSARGTSHAQLVGVQAVWKIDQGKATK